MTKPKLVIGCPTFERAWALPIWFDMLEAQKLQEDYDITFCFAYTRSFDGTFDILENRASRMGDLKIYQYNLPTFENRDLHRLPMLAQVRNALLNMVREEEPDYFLSFDDDILFPPDAIRKLFTISKPNNAVGALIDMGGNNEMMHYPSVMHFPNGPGELAFRRPFNEYDWSKPFKADIIMAVKLMGKEVYEKTEYRWDPVGEDIGWCHSCEDLGFDRWIHPDVQGIHMYDKLKAVEVMKAFPEAGYPELLYPLSRWWIQRDEWKLTK